MNEPRAVGFYVGQIEDGRFVAASTSAPYFCFVEDSEETAVGKANAALDFFFNHKGTVTQRKPLASKQVVNFLPQRHVDLSSEYACA